MEHASPVDVRTRVDVRSRFPVFGSHRSPKSIQESTDTRIENQQPAESSRQTPFDSKSSALPNDPSSHRTPEEQLLSNSLDHFVPSPAPLSIQERQRILESAAAELRSIRNPTSILPFVGSELSPGLLAAFTDTRSQLRHVKDELFVLPRSVYTTLAKGEGGMFFTKDSRHQVFVYKRTPFQHRQKIIPIFQFVGMLELGKLNHNAVRNLPKHVTSRSVIVPIGPDSFVDYSDMAT